MRKVFSNLLERIEDFFATEKYLNQCERSILRTVLSDFKGSIDAGYFDKERKNPLEYELCKLEMEKDSIIYFQHSRASGYAVKRIHFGKETPSFGKLAQALEEMGFKVKMSRVIQINNHPNPIQVSFTIPGKD